MPTIDIDGRGKTPEDAIRDMWTRVLPLQDKGNTAVSTVEVVDTKTNQVVETFQLTDTRWDHLKPNASKTASQKNAQEEHKPPRQHEFPFKIRVRMQA